MTPAGVLVPAGLLGLVLGWALRPAAYSLDRAAPHVGWVQVAAVWLVAGLVALVARHTWRTVRGELPWRAVLEPHRAVNRVVLGKASAVAGAALLGGYAGHGISLLGVGAPGTLGRALATLAAAAGAVALLSAALWLEHACRTEEGEPGDLR